ncbi:Deoxyhypusine hydroxylase [Nadsonia fulvescens var. elongata DSM 6958]|uniref:Deoxyhypusine hydroxylase n=1 Tax=Nadsonia fulvescens var. elongata DSM 6958 TaxID=857566 RepID=A0A1E3PRI6_9ASCO|nr:Deoxyhypusine hydroxylase [Nadsonia fulvescens var. elongata DSM 6958]
MEQHPNIIKIHDEPEETLETLRSTLLNISGEETLALRFRALFSLKCLAEEGKNEAIDIIAEAFADESELLKHEVAYVLGQTKNLYAVKALREVLVDTNQQVMVRHEAAEGIGALGDESSLELLEHYYKEDPLVVIRETCELAIERIKWEQSQKNGEKEQLQESMFSSIDPAPPLPNENNDKIAKLQAKLNDQEETLFNRYRAMFRLRDIGTTEAVLALASGFKDPSALFRHEIAYVFGQLCSPASVPALIEVLGNVKEEGMVRHEAAEALGSIATDDVLPILKKFAEDSERVVRESALIALDMYEYETSGQLEYASVSQA